jgi:voltage-gated sodium channel
MVHQTVKYTTNTSPMTDDEDKTLGAIRRENLESTTTPVSETARTGGDNNERKEQNRRVTLKSFKALNSLDSIDEDKKGNPCGQAKSSFRSLGSMDESRHGLERLRDALDLSRSQHDAHGLDLEDNIDEEFKLGDPLHDDKYKIGHMRNTCGALVNSEPTQWLITFFILLNALILGVMTFVVDNESATNILEVLDLSLLISFTVEMVFQLAYLGPTYLYNGWLVFDGLIILFSWIFLGSSISILRSFRIFRTFALISRWESLRKLVAAIGSTLPKMATIWTALLIFFYTFCVLYTNLYHELYDEGYLDYDYFGRLDKTFLTLFQMMTLDSWTGVVRQVVDARPWAWIGFCAFVVITAFFVLNLVVAVICESLLELNNVRDANRQNKMMKQQRNMIHHQTEQLLEETRQVVELQRLMLTNQLSMQEVLVEIAEHMGARPAAQSQTRKKSGLKILIDELDVDDGMSTRSPTQNAKDEVVDTLTGSL